MIAYERIQELAKKRHFSNLQEVAEKAGIAKNLIYSWKKKKPSTDSLKAVAIVLNTTTDYLNGLTNDPSPIHDALKDDEPGITWTDLDMPYGGAIPDDLKNMYKAIAEQYVKDHPDKFKGSH
ncbi:helix-turn-helix domain-containing protein [Lactobacillus amylovorus]|uniref:helix-turn-helix domain-containing protein n=1 Tax=Lactobacillus amylovorus TaxID=1604 RepID=UPI003F97CA8C